MTGFREQVRRLLGDPRVRAELDRIAALPPREEAGKLDTYRLLGERGWLAPDWPVEYGGAGLGATEAATVTEELALAGVPDDAHVLSIDIVGAFVLRAGTERQRATHLPALAAGDRLAAVLLTEPECGSDLSRLATRAEPDGDGWRLYGTKIYHQKAHFADVALCAARTTRGEVPLHGITLFLVPLQAAGVHLQPVPSIADDRFNRLTFDGLRVGPDDVLGRVDDGWTLLNDMLLLERTGIDFHAKGRRRLDAILRHAAATGRLNDPVYAADLAALDAALLAGHAAAWQMVANLQTGTPDPVTSAMTKWYVTEQLRGVVHAGLDAYGADGLLSAWDPDAPDRGRLDAAYRLAPAHRLASGTSEVMLNVVAASGMGLL